MPPSAVKRTPFSIASTSSSLPQQQFGVVAQAALPDGQEVLRVVQHDAKPFASYSTARPAAQRTAVQFVDVVPLLTELSIVEEQTRLSIEIDAAKALETLTLLGRCFSTFSKHSSELPNKRQRCDDEPLQRTANCELRHRSKHLVQQWRTTLHFLSTSRLGFPQKTKTLQSSTNEEYFSHSVDGCGDILAQLATSANPELGMQCILAQLRIRGADAEVLRCVECVLEDARFGSLHGAVPFLHALFLASIGLVGAWFHCEIETAAVGSSLCYALRLLLAASSPYPIDSVRVEDGLMVYKALSTICYYRDAFTPIVGEDSMGKLEKLLLSTLTRAV
ncbi:Hypothetical protein, putative [Bodo saltans]|uniref:Uncharacterized protein n=1 Tax=Bodo saltans TaxID=75058 RepID=A0A0S4JHZ0_BODSA|nr:Hypothetical protein, putative [Bodo saltans]|eukprot:CUG89986.1 Hypothetical protein, putative [Bodo saltans]